MRRGLIFLAFLMVMATPAVAHTEAERDAWHENWIWRLSLAGDLNSDLMAELVEFQRAHIPLPPPPRQISPTATETAPEPTETADMEQWPGDWVALVATYFRPEDVRAALKVINCESGFVLTAKNPSSSALGPWQFLRSTWDRMVAPNTGSPPYDAGGPMDPVWSTINASWLWYNVGPSQWVCY